MSLRARVTVESFNYSACGLVPGDSFDVSATGVTVPSGKEFCFFAVTNTVAALQPHLLADEPDAWLLSEPLLACPDTPEDLRMRVRVLPETTPAEETD